MPSMSQMRQNSKIKAITLLRGKAYQFKELASILSNYNTWKLKTNESILKELEELGYCTIRDGIIKVIE